MRADGKNWLTYTPPTGISKTGALDFSWLNDGPVGKHGHVTTKDGHFVFEDGTPVKFFGVNLGFEIARPDKKVAEVVAEDLYRSGANMARIHAIDCSYGGIIDYKQETTQHFDPVELDKLDYLIYCLREKGIYLHLDMTAGRIFKAADGFNEEELEYLSRNARAVRFFDERIIKLESEFITNYLTHRNPYTGLRYCDDPAVAIVQYTNENSITWYQLPGTRTAFDKVLDMRFNVWLCDKYGSRDAVMAAWTNADGLCFLGDEEDPFAGTVRRPPLSSWGEPLTEWNNPVDAVNPPIRHAEHMAFLREIEENTFKGVYKMIRDLGYKSAINLSNYPEAAVDVKMNSLGDVMEKNPYWNHPLGPYQPPAQFFPHSMADTDPRIPQYVHFSHSLGVASRGRVADKPFMITEWNAGNPTDFRADALFQMASYGAFQDWDGFTLFIYSFYGDEETFFNENRFDSFFISHVDPSMWAQFGIAAAIFRLGLVSKAKNAVELAVSKEDMLVQSAEFWRLPMLIPFVSKFGYRFFDEVFASDADLAVSVGCTASGDYSKAKKALVQSYNPFCDAMQKDKNRQAWLDRHTECGSKTVAVGDGNLLVGKKTAVYDGGVSNVTLGGKDADAVLTAAMRGLGLISDKQGWYDDKVVTDTDEITYDVRNGHFRVATDRIAIYAGKANGLCPVGQGTLQTENPWAGVALFPLDGETIRKSRHFLVYAMGRCTNTDRQWDGDKLITYGEAPIIYENVVGKLTVPSDFTCAEGWLLDSVGNRGSCISTDSAENGFAVTLGGGHMYEIIVK